MLCTYDFKLQNDTMEIVDIVSNLQEKYLDEMGKIQDKENPSAGISRDEIILAAEFVSESALQVISTKWVNELSEAVAILSNQEAIELFITLNKSISIGDAKKLSNNQKKFLLKDELKKTALLLFEGNFFDKVMHLSSRVGLAVRTVLHELKFVG